MLKRLQNLKGEPEKFVKYNREIICEHELKMVPHSGSGFDSWLILNNLPEWSEIVNIIKTGKEIISQKFIMVM